MQQDLADAAAELQDPTLLSIVSAGTDRLTGVSDNLLPFDARLRRVLGGGMMSLNVRVAREVLRQGWPLRAPELAARLAAIAEGLEPVTSPVRAPQDDDAVRTFLLEELERDPSQHCSPLLRKLRDERNWACEQKRFRTLFYEVRASEPTRFGS